MREPIDLDELRSARPLAEVRPWVESLCARYKKTTELHDYFVARRGLTNKLQGELLPLAQLCERLAPDRPESQLMYFPGSSQSFDAQVLSMDGSVQETLEVTLACHGHSDAIAREYLKQYGWAPLWIPLAYSGRKNTRELPLPEMQSMDTEQTVEDGLTLIRDAVEAKSSSRKYEGISLVVGLDDFRFLPNHIEHVKIELEKLISAFQVIYYVGHTGHFFYAQRTGA